MAAFKNKDNGTWYVQFRYTDWKGERQQKLKRGFATKKEAQAWEREFLMEKQADINMTFESFVGLYHVSTGKKLWAYEVHQGTVLYLALEDDFQRIQSRMFRMYGVDDTPNLHFATAAGKIGNGLDEQLANFVREHTDTKLM